jgi:hypothetical protein
MLIEDSVKQSLDAARRAIKECQEGGDPATSVWCELDGRKVPEKLKNDEILNVTVDDDYRLRLNLLTGTDIQNHKKKMAMYKAFCEEMKENGFDLGHSIETYSR